MSLFFFLSSRSKEGNNGEELLRSPFSSKARTDRVSPARRPQNVFSLQEVVAVDRFPPLLGFSPLFSFLYLSPLVRPRSLSLSPFSEMRCTRLAREETKRDRKEEKRRKMRSEHSLPSFPSFSSFPLPLPPAPPPRATGNKNVDAPSRNRTYAPFGN